MQSNNSSEKVYKTYINARNAIDSVYSTNNPYHDRLKQLLEPTTDQGIAMMQEVEACRLGAIKKMYAYLNRLIRYITWNNNAPTLGKQAASNDELSLSKQAALGSLTMFYSITYSFAIIDLVSFLDLEATRLLQPYLLPSRVDINIHWLAATNLYLTDYIETNDTNRNQINSRVQDFIKHVSRLVKQAKNNNNNDDICQLVKKTWELKAPFFIEEEARVIVE